MTRLHHSMQAGPSQERMVSGADYGAQVQTWPRAAVHWQKYRASAGLAAARKVTARAAEANANDRTLRAVDIVFMTISILGLPQDVMSCDVCETTRRRSRALFRG